MQGVLYEDPTFFTFAFITFVLGGLAAWSTGRASAQGWKKPVILVFYVLLLGCAVRFIHFSVFEGTLLSLRYYLVDTIVLMAIAFASYRYHLAHQMASRYWWVYERTGPFSWRERPSPLESRPARNSH